MCKRASHGSHPTPAAALTLGALGVTGLVEWPLLLAIGGGALLLKRLNHARDNGSHAAPAKAVPAKSTSSPATRAKVVAAKPTKSTNSARPRKTPAKKAPARQPRGTQPRSRR